MAVVHLIQGTVNTGESIVRTLLNVTCMQTQVASMLLEKLPEFMVITACSLISL
jgi:hypothetical protein